MSEKDAEKSALDKLSHIDDLIKRGEITIFDTEEVAVIKKMVKAWLFFETFGSFSRVLKNVVVTAGVLIGAWLAIRNGLIDWLRGLSL